MAIRIKEVVTGFLWTILCVSFLYTCFGCDEVMFPTVADVNTLADAEREFQMSLQQGTVDAMTEQHAIQDPAVRSELELVRGQYDALAAQLKERADAVRAKGLDVVALGSFGGANDWFTAIAGLFGFGGIAGWLSNLLKPSRATKRIDELENRLAVAAPAGESFPGDKQ